MYFSSPTIHYDNQTQTIIGVVSIIDPNNSVDILNMIVDYHDLQDLANCCIINKKWNQFANMKHNIEKFGSILFNTFNDLDIFKAPTSKNHTVNDNLLFKKYGKCDWWNDMCFFNKPFLLMSCQFNKQTFIKKMLPLVGERINHFNERRKLCQANGIFTLCRGLNPYQEEAKTDPLYTSREEWRRIFLTVLPPLRKKLQHNKRSWGLVEYIGEICRFILDMKQAIREWASLSRNDVLTQRGLDISNKTNQCLARLFEMCVWFAAVDNQRYTMQDVQKYVPPSIRKKVQSLNKITNPMELFINETMFKLCLKIIGNKIDHFDYKQTLKYKLGWTKCGET